MDEKSSSIGVGGGGGASGRGPRRMCARTIACCCSAMSAWSDLRWSAMSSRAISCMRSSPMSAAERERGGEGGRWGGEAQGVEAKVEGWGGGRVARGQGGQRGDTRRCAAVRGAEQRSARCAHYAHTWCVRPSAISSICSNINSVCRAAATSSSLERLVWRALGSHMMARLPLPAPSVCAYFRQSGQHSAVCEPYRHQCRMWLIRQ